MRRHPAKLAAAGIDPARYDELRAICRQYVSYVRAARALRLGETDRRPGSGVWRQSDPTGNRAAQLADDYAAARVAAIEGAARHACGPIWRAMLQNVAKGVDYDRMIPPPACGRAQFYRMRLDFFIALDAVVGRWQPRKIDH